MKIYYIETICRVHKGHRVKKVKRESVFIIFFSDKCSAIKLPYTSEWLYGCDLILFATLQNKILAYQSLQHYIKHIVSDCEDRWYLWQRLLYTNSFIIILDFSLDDLIFLKTFLIKRKVESQSSDAFLDKVIPNTLKLIILAFVIFLYRE